MNKLSSQSVIFGLIGGALAAGLLSLSTTSNANDPGQGPSPGDQQIAEVTAGAGFIDFALETTPSFAILRITGPQGYAVTRRVEGEAFITTDLLLDAEPPRHKIEETGQLDGIAWDSIPEGQYFYELMVYTDEGDRLVKNGHFQVKSGKAELPQQSRSQEQAPNQPRSLNPSQQDGDGLSSHDAPNWFERLVGTALDIIVPSAHAQNVNADEYVYIFDANNDANTRINFENDGFENIGLAYIDGSFHLARGVGPTFGDRLMSWNILGKVGIHTTSPQEILHVNDPDNNNASIRISNTANAFNLHTGQSTGFSIEQVGEGTPFQIAPLAPTGSIHVNASGNIGLGTTSPTNKLHLMGDMTITGATPHITFDNTSGGLVDWGMGESGDDFRISQSNGTDPGTHLTIQEGGDVGIGTTTPIVPGLHVKRNARAALFFEAGPDEQSDISLGDSGLSRFVIRTRAITHNFEIARRAESGGPLDRPFVIPFATGIPQFANGSNINAAAEPGAPNSGGTLFVDAGDGDLKVKFANGTVKTLATN